MSAKHRRTLAAIFEDPVRASILWSDIESMLKNMGASVESGSGSRVWVAFGRVRATFHRPHPQKETKRRVVVSLRRFLSRAGVTP
jgi:hypothetical protein